MSRSGYSEDFDYDDNSVWLYRGAVKSAIKGRRGQAFLKDLAAALDAMPEKRLAASEWIAGGNACALGVAAKSRGLQDAFAKFDPDDASAAANAAHMLNIAESMAREIVYMNDEGSYAIETDEARFTRMRAWIASRIIPADAP